MQHGSAFAHLQLVTRGRRSEHIHNLRQIPDADGVARAAPRRLAPGLRAAAHSTTLRHVHTRPAMSRAALWVSAAVLVALLLGVGVGADAQECAHAMLLPGDTTITPPAADVPADLAPFSGAWGGVWTDHAGRSVACTALVV